MTLQICVLENAFWLAFFPIHGISDGNGNLTFRIDDHPIKAVGVTTNAFYMNACVYWDEAVTLARYMTEGKRFAVELPGYFTAVFDISGFEFANFDPLRRFVFA